MMPPNKKNPRAEYRLREAERANLSPSLVEKFPKLKSLKAELTYFDSDGMTQTGAISRKSVTAGTARTTSVWDGLAWGSR